MATLLVGLKLSLAAVAGLWLQMMEIMDGEEGEAGAVVTNLQGSCEVPAAGQVLGVLRYQVSVSQDTTLAATLTVSSDEVRRTIQMLLVDNASGDVVREPDPVPARCPAYQAAPRCAPQVLCPSGRLAARLLPASPKGYTLVAVAVGTQLTQGMDGITPCPFMHPAELQLKAGTTALWPQAPHPTRMGRSLLLLQPGCCNCSALFPWQPSTR